MSFAKQAAEVLTDPYEFRKLSQQAIPTALDDEEEDEEIRRSRRNMAILGTLGGLGVLGLGAYGYSKLNPSSAKNEVRESGWDDSSIGKLWNLTASGNLEDRLPTATGGSLSAAAGMGGSRSGQRLFSQLRKGLADASNRGLKRPLGQGGWWSKPVGALGRAAGVPLAGAQHAAGFGVPASAADSDTLRQHLNEAQGLKPGDAPQGAAARPEKGAFRRLMETSDPRARNLLDAFSVEVHGQEKGRATRRIAEPKEINARIQQFNQSLDALGDDWRGNPTQQGVRSTRQAGGELMRDLLNASARRQQVETAERGGKIKPPSRYKEWVSRNTPAGKLERMTAELDALAGARARADRVLETADHSSDIYKKSNQFAREYGKLESRVRNQYGMGIDDLAATMKAYGTTRPKSDVARTAFRSIAPNALINALSWGLGESEVPSNDPEDIAAIEAAYGAE